MEDRITKLYKVLCFAVFSFILFSSLKTGFNPLEIAALSSDELSALEGEEVTLRGFVYRDEEDRFILDSQPDLKSCCIGSENRIKSQIILEEPLARLDGSHPVVVKGIFHYHPKRSRDGKYTQYALLSRPVLIPESSSYLGLLIFLSVIAVFSYPIYKLLKAKRNF